MKSQLEDREIRHEIAFKEEGLKRQEKQEERGCKSAQDQARKGFCHHKPRIVLYKEGRGVRFGKYLSKDSDVTKQGDG